MSKDTLTHISIITTPEAEEAICEMMESVYQQPPSTFRKENSDKVCVSVYVPNLSAEEIASTTKLVQLFLQRIEQAGLKYGNGVLKIQQLPDSDWAESWKEHFPPLSIRRTLLIKPSWDKTEPAPGQIVIILDPGLSFGTGHHPTTRFCLERLISACRKKKNLSLLDVGTGSGILAIAASKLGYMPIHAFDYDPQCIGIANENAATNTVKESITFAVQDLKAMPNHGTTTYDVICANLEYDLLISEADKLINRLKTNGILILAGILDCQFDAVSLAYCNKGMQLTSHRKCKEWHSGAFQRACAA